MGAAVAETAAMAKPAMSTIGCMFDVPTSTLGQEFISCQS
jgi:hypothetical protein